ncbi:MAG: endonuclease/exonuclease/phosphatase family protein [Pirellulaceae bacterium]|nr:endonuclease/exonuclease/phosphatase family protein [Pirellulaceae bacterium]
MSNLTKTSSPKIRSWFQSRFRLASFGLVATVSIAALVTPLARYWWLADLVANLRVQLVIGMTFALVGLLILRSWRWLAVLGALTIWQTLAFSSAFTVINVIEFPQASAAHSASENGTPGTTLRVFLLNALTGNDQHDRIVEQIRQSNPDVIAILELSSALQQRLQAEFGNSYSTAICESQDDGNFGIGIWTRLPARDAGIFQLSLPGLPSAEVDVRVGDQWVHIVANHPLPPIGPGNFAERNRHLQLLAQRLREPHEQSANSVGDHRATLRKSQEQTSREATIVVGDLNLTPWSPWFDDLLATTHLTSAAAGRGLQPTWYRWPTLPFGLVLDHGLYSKELHCNSRTILSDCGSDHRAVVFEFSEAVL